MTAAPPLQVSTWADWGCVPVPVESLPVPGGMAVHYPGPGRYRHADHADCLRTVKAWDTQHRARGSRMLEYGGVVCQHGHYIEGRGRWDRLVVRPGSNGTIEANRRRASVQLMAGTLDAPPADVELQWLAQVVARARAQGLGPVVDGHRDHVATSCPGDPLYQALPLIDRYATTPPTTEDDDMNEDQARKLQEVWEVLFAGGPGTPHSLTLYQRVKRIEDQVARIEAATRPDEKG